MNSEEKCDASCPECGDTGSMWVCTRWTNRIRQNMDVELAAKKQART